MRKILLILMTLLLGSSVWAGAKTGADFLKIPIGARSASLGNAATALSAGAESMNWNPSGLAGLDTMTMSLSHQQMFGENDLDNIALSIPRVFSPRTTAGFSVTRLSYAEQERRGADRSVSGTFGSSDMSVAGALAHDFGGLRLGGGLKWVRQELAGRVAQGAALDLGFLARTPVSQLTVGGSVRHLGQAMRFNEVEYRLPTTVSLGSTYRIMKSLALSFDVHHRPYQSQTTAAFGAEFSPLSMIALRAGYLNRLAEAVSNNQSAETNRGNFSGVNGLSMGLGVRVGQFLMDYAVTPFGEIGEAHAFTLSLAFGRSASQPQTIEAPSRSITVFDPALSREPWWGKQP